MSEFGNSAPTWNSPSEWRLSHKPGWFHIRNRVAGGPTWYNVKDDVLEPQWEQCVSEGCDPSLLYISAMAPTELTLVQGEVMNGPGAGLYLFYSRVAKPMRDALKAESHTLEGIMATRLLRHFMCPNSFDWMMALLDRYEDHVVEFSTYDCEWGTLPGFNTVFWEVRLY